MKKKSLLKKCIYLILIIILIVPVLLTLFGDRALKAGIETAASKSLNVGVKLEDISLSILTGAVELDNLTIANPKEYENSNLLKASNARIDLNVKSLISDTVEIENLIFNDITIVLEQKGFTNNLKQILDSMPEPDYENTGKKLLIKNLEINNITVVINLLPIPGSLDNHTLKLTPIKMTNLGSGNKLSVPELTAKIFTAIILGVAEKATGIIPDEITKPIKEVLGTGSNVIIKSGAEVIKGVGGIFKIGTDAGIDILDGLIGSPKKKDD